MGDLLVEAALLDLLVAGQIEYREYGRQVVVLAHRYLAAERPSDARRLLSRLEPRFLVGDLVAMVMRDRDLERRVRELADRDLFARY